MTPCSKEGFGEKGPRTSVTEPVWSVWHKSQLRLKASEQTRKPQPCIFEKGKGKRRKDKETGSRGPVRLCCELLVRSA